METLQCRKVELEAAILTDISVMSQAEGHVRAQSIRRATLLNKELDDVEQEITQTMRVIKPWEDFYTSRSQCKEMEGPSVRRWRAAGSCLVTMQHLLTDLKNFLPVSEQQNPDPVQNAMDITPTDIETGEKVVSEDGGGSKWGVSVLDIFAFISVSEVEFDMSFKLSVRSEIIRFAVTCSSLRHTHRQCPDVWHNIVKACPRVERELFGQEEVIEQETGRAGGLGRGGVEKDRGGRGRKEGPLKWESREFQREGLVFVEVKGDSQGVKGIQ
ncbi:hypothetical protein XELAEV_18001785mg, partial [Xenopus laevis]